MPHRPHDVLLLPGVGTHVAGITSVAEGLHHVKGCMGAIPVIGEERKVVGELGASAISGIVAFMGVTANQAIELSYMRILLAEDWVVGPMAPTPSSLWLRVHNSNCDVKRWEC